eukprot:CAMPEP_0197608164 /NCGR_PEP_ID=MMETSP1326-20131121/48515_1 /TAXON_ID=1155430 /ORGANISM="Genus nov. species nov., Strain RCC2288" /LENGTH=243 /DNA_ID=CAMNT_0043176329 /DNA_START=182 /DNA_END=909 /DNA_ORIENTATION=+
MAPKDGKHSLASLSHKSLNVTMALSKLDKARAQKQLRLTGAGGPKLAHFNADFKLQESELDDDKGPHRLQTFGQYFEVPLTRGLTLPQMLSSVCKGLYGPLMEGQEEERWKVISQVKTQMSVGDTSKDGAVDEFHVVSDYEGVRVALVHYPLAYDARVPDAVPSKEDLTAELWEALMSTQPKEPAAMRHECLGLLVAKAKAAVASGDVKFEEEVIHGMWELAVKKEHLADFPAEAFEQIVAGG